MVPMREVMRSAGSDQTELARIHKEVCVSFHADISVCPLTLPQGFQLRPLVFSDFFQADGTSALPPKEMTLEAVLDKLVST